MSVLRSRRKIAFTEYERNMGLICKLTDERLNKVPARYQKFVNPTIYEPINKAYTLCVLITEVPPGSKTAFEKRKAYVDEAIKCIKQLQKPLLAVWNLLDISEGGMQVWVDMLNREFALLYGVIKQKESIPSMIIALPKRKIERLAFMKKMSELHKYTYMKIGHAPNYCKDFLSCEIARYIDTALYSLAMANSKIPETKAEAVRREERLRNAIDNLNGMQRPLLALWNIIDYSEREMDEWAGLLSEEIRLLQGLIKADRERYKDLK